MASEPATEPASTPPNDTTRWAKWAGAFTLGGAILAVIIALCSLTLARYGVIDKLSGFIGFMMLLNPLRALAFIGLVTFVVALAMHKRPVWQAILGSIIALVLLAVMYTQVIFPAGEAPPLHDISTNLEDPPQFRALELREDNLIPFNNIEEWRAAHREGYPDIDPVLINKSPTDVLADARTLAEQRGWDIVSADPQAGRMEATAYAGYIRFMDDVVVEVTPVADGSTRVDMRSVSRVGVSDLGYNAARIEGFLADLQAM